MESSIDNFHCLCLGTSMPNDLFLKKQNRALIEKEFRFSPGQLLNSKNRLVADRSQGQRTEPPLLLSGTTAV